MNGARSGDAGHWSRLRLPPACLLCSALLATGALAQEPTAWQLLDDGDPPGGYVSTTMVYDSARGVTVQLQSWSQAPSVTWELIGDDWSRRLIDAPTLGSSCAAYDPDRGVTVLFGGSDDDSLFTDETWEYDGAAWVQRFPVTSPPPRHWCAMAYDTDRQVMVMFGGYIEVGFTGSADTWEYDGTDWVEVSTRDAPSPRGEPAMTYDPGRGEIVLFGGLHDGVVDGGTWTYNGRNWKLKNVATAPSARSAAGLVYDPGLGKTILFGGATTTWVFGDTWEWSGTGWTELSPPTSPPDRMCKLVYDTGRQQVLVHAGKWDSGGYNDTWVFDGTTWTEIAISGLPAPRAYHALAYDPLQDALVLYGGLVLSPAGQESPQDTWVYSGGTWTEDTGGGAPTAHFRFGLAFSEAVGGVVGFSGWLPNFSTVQDRHERLGDPGLWSSTPESFPDPRYAHGWTAAPALGGIVLFGGAACCDAFGAGYLANDTWIFDGTGWILESPATLPEGRFDTPLAFDTATGEIVLYGGMQAGSVEDSATWLFDGDDWQQLFETSPPGDRYGHSLAYDESREVVVLFGSAETGVEGVTWEFDGSVWTARPTPFQPETNRRWSPLAYDSKREVVMMFGGQRGVRRNDTWAYGADPDEDGIVGGLDNCREVVNPAQANADEDPAGDVCDCAVTDPGSFGTPMEVNNVSVDGDSVSWGDQASTIGDAVRYDLATGDLAELRANGGFMDATCLAPSLATPNHLDTRVPTTGNGFYYLARATNACGVGTYGAARVDLDAASPCP